MTKTLSLWRHAKAHAEHAHGQDHARTLSELGEADAAFVARQIREHHWLPQVILCSTSTRTRQTRAALSSTLATELYDTLYLASAEQLLQQIHLADDAVQHVMVIGHNPGFHKLACDLMALKQACPHAKLLREKFPTSACAMLQFEIDSWHEMRERSGDLLRVIHPRH